MKYTDSDFEHMYEPDIDLDMWCCVNCGAFADTVAEIKHYDTCKPGEAEYWRKFYEENPD